MKIETIVTAVDLDDDLCMAVIKTGISLAERFGAEIHVIDAWPPLSDVGFPYAQRAAVKTIQQDEAARNARREELAEKLSLLEPRAITMVPVGETADAIAKYARAQDADLLVIGSHQKGLFERMMGGGTSAEIIHAAPCGLFLVTPGFAEALND